MADAKISKAQTKRKTYVNQIVRINQFVETKMATSSVADAELRLSALQTCFDNFEGIQTTLEELDVTEADSNARAEFEEVYFSLQPKLTTFIREQTINSFKKDDIHKNTNATPKTKKVQLPKVPLPTFSGEYTDWLTFYETFLNLVHNNEEFDDISRFHYLRSSLTGSALKRIESLEVTATNYDVALTLLSSRYDRKVVIIHEHIKKLFSLPNASRGNVSSLRHLIDTVQSNHRALKSLGRPVAHWDDVIIHLMLSKIDSLTSEKWNDECTVDVMPTLDDFINFLEKRCHHLEGPAHQRHNDSSTASTSKKEFKHSAARASFNTTRKSIRCSHCQNSTHLIYQCPKFKNLSPQNRFNFIKQSKLCINCLRTGHSSSSCNSKKRCRTCSTTHHTLLHFNNTAGNTPTNPTQQLVDRNEVSAVAYHSSTSIVTLDAQKHNSSVLLATALVHVLNKRGEPVICRALLDSGAQLHFMSKRLASELGIKTTKVHIPIGGIGNITTTIQSTALISLKSLSSSFEVQNIEVHILPAISEPLPDQYIDIRNWPIPTNVHLADPNFNTPTKIDLLIGAELYLELLEPGNIKLGAGLPILQNTHLGWILTGRTSINPTTKYRCNVATKPSIASLEKLVQSFWEIERHDAPLKTTTIEEQQAEIHFASTHKRLPSGQFMVRLPFREDPTDLGDSMSTATRRLFSLERKLSRDNNLKQSYSQFMEDYKKLNHMTKLSATPHPNFILPHHCVIKPDSSTTKLRVVFDGSAKTTSGKSLNEILLIGPTVQPDLFTVILRFRLHRYVFAADISKMYRQIMVDPRDRDYQLVFWRCNSDEQPSTFQLNTVTYGTSCAPFLATRCLNQLAIDEQANFPEAANAILQNIYVDDCMTGANNIAEAKNLQDNIIALLRRGGLELRKFCANDDRLLEHIPMDHQEKRLSIQGNDVVKTLGLIWQPDRDVFQFYIPPTDSREITTKRSVLSDLGRIFDPLGLIGPAVVLGKIYFQQLWKQKFSWDEPLPPDLSNRWIKYLNQLEDLSSAQIKRHLLTTNHAVSVELHAFCDSSESAYGSSCYLVSKDKFGQVNSQLICSKSRVAPTKHTSIPRLELCAALLMAELVDRLLNILPITFNNIVYYSDSKDVLAWIASPSYTWQTFVANRVAKLQELTRLEQWRYVNTKENPADLISRGVLPKILLSSTLWFNGPYQLCTSSAVGESPSTLSLNEITEKRHTKFALTTIVVYDSFQNLQHTSSLSTLERTFAYCFRFIKNSKVSNKDKSQRTTGPLAVHEIESGLQLLIRHVQIIAFENEYKKLVAGKDLENGSNLRSLNLFIDQFGIIRVGGRLLNSNAPYEAKHQMVLPKNHLVSKLIMRTYHTTHMHAAPQTLLALIRQKYWPIDGKNLARRTVNNCLRCFKFKPRGIHQLMGNLPTDRVIPSRPFAVSGIDFCGPVNIYIRVRGKTPTKAYIAVFICFSTRAVHLEVVSDLSSAAFLAALKRFIGRRGLCNTIYCDNATNFVGCKNELAELANLFESQQLKAGLQQLCQLDRINWKPIPPRSPHFGGLWEAAVKTAKYHLRRTIADAALTFEELNTVVIQAEAILNSRPLTPLSADANDLEALTPGHFLIGAPITSFAEPNITDIPTNRLSRYRRLEQMKQIFWRRWSSEYLNLLQQRNKWSIKKPNLDVGTLVLVGDDNLPSYKWLLGRITRLYSGNDGLIRVADVRTKVGTYKRSIVRLYPLPLNDEIIEDTEYLQGGRHVQSSLNTQQSNHSSAQ